MERVSTLFLKVTLVFLALPVLALCTLGLPRIAGDAIDYFSAGLTYPVLIAIYASLIPFFYTLFQTYKLLSYIDKNIAFSDLSVSAIKHIKYSAFTISALYAACWPFLLLMADKDDAPGLLAIGLIISFAALVVGVFAAVLQKLLKQAIDIKSENDLTV